LPQEHKTVSLARTRTRTVRSGVKRTNYEATAPRYSAEWSTIAIGIKKNYFRQNIASWVNLDVSPIGELPYKGVTGVVELHDLLQEGARLPKPPHCSDEL